MPTASRQVRKIRRIKRAKTLAYQGMDLAIRQRDHARMVAQGLETELKRIETELHKFTADPFPEGEDLTPIQEATKPTSLTIKRIEDSDAI